MKNEELKKLAMYKVEGKDFADDVFLVFLHVEDHSVIVIALTDDEINQINLAGLEDSVLDINVNDSFIQEKIFAFDALDDKHDPLDVDSIEQLIEGQMFYSGIVNEAGIEKLVGLIKDNYVSKVSIEEFEDQVFEVEGVRIKVTDPDADEEDWIDKDYVMIDAYPYTQPMDGEVTVDELRNERILPLITTIVPKHWW